MNNTDEVPGWERKGEKDDWTMYVPLDNGDRRPVVVEYRKAPPKCPEWTREQWHRHQVAILSRALPIDPRDFADLARRFTDVGITLTPEHLTRLGAVSLSNGYLIPTVLPDGNLCRGQICQKRTGGKYVWQMPNKGIDGHVGGEIPLTLWHPLTPQESEIDRLLVEGLGVKPYITAERTGIPTVGASGGHWASSPQFLMEAICTAKGTAKTVGICPDGGAIVNRTTLGSYHRTQEFLEGQGVTVLYGWWGQETKAHDDIDELPDPSVIQWITPGEFWGKVSHELMATVLAPSQPVDLPTWQTQRVRDMILNPWGDREREVTVARTIDEAIAFLSANALVMIDGPTGMGKSEILAQAIGIMAYEPGQNFWAVPRRSIAGSIAKTLGIPYRGCIHSLHTWELPDEYVLVIDELEQSLEELIIGSLCRDNRHHRIEQFRKAVQGADRVYMASATARYGDLEYLESVRGEQFQILRIDLENKYPKGDLELIVPNHQVKGSYRYAQKKAFDAIGKHSYVATDTAYRAKRIHIGLNNPEAILCTSQTRDEDNARGLLNSDNPGQYLADRGNPTVIMNSMGQSGYSIKPPAEYGTTVGIISGKIYSPSDCIQSVGRVRGSQPVIMSVPAFATVPNPITSGKIPQGRAMDRRYTQFTEELATLEAQHQGYSDGWKGFDFVQDSPEHKWLFRHMEHQRICYGHYAVAVAAYAERDGRKVTITQIEEPGEGLPSVGKQVLIWKATPIYEAKQSDLPRLGKTDLTMAEESAMEAKLIRRYYGITWDQPLSMEQILEEDFGRGRRSLESVQRIIYEGKAAADDARRREKLGIRGYVWDTTCHELSVLWNHAVGFNDVLLHCLTEEYGSRDPVIRNFADRLHQHREEIPVRVFGVKVPIRGDDYAKYYGQVVKWLGMVLKLRFGLKTYSTRHRSEESLETLYRVDPGDLERLREAVARHHEAMTDYGYRLRSTPLTDVFFEVSIGSEQSPPTPPDPGYIPTDPPDFLAYPPAA